MSTLHRAVTGHVTKFLSTVGERQIRVVASDATPDRVGDILEPTGCDLSQFRRNPVMLAQHDPSKPIGIWPQVEVRNGRLEALGEFAPEGVSEVADEYCRLAKAGVVKAVSVGFISLASEPLKNGGRRYTAWELVEMSLVSVPANPNALVTERGYPGYRGSQRRMPSAPAPEREPMPIHYAGTLEQRQWQADRDNVALRRRRACVLRLKAGLI